MQLSNDREEGHILIRTFELDLNSTKTGEVQDAGSGAVQFTEQTPEGSEQERERERKILIKTVQTGVFTSLKAPWWAIISLGDLSLPDTCWKMLTC